MRGNGTPQEAEGRPRGLTSAQARRLLREHGANDLNPRPARSVPADLARRLRSPLVLILLAASAVSAFTGDVASFVIIAITVMLSVAIDFVQEHRAGRAAEALIRRVQVHANVVRDGRPVPLPVSRLVPGDVVNLAAGSVIPGDGALLEANGLHVNEALLTGEPFPVEKRPGHAHGIDLFMGTSVVSGSAVMRIVRTGAATEVGKIARTLAAEPPPTSFERGLRAFGMLIMRITAFLVLFVLLVNAALNRPLLESFVFAVALAVGLTPELLPMILSVTLSRGALRLSREHVIVKRLAAIEGLGSMDVLCTDKTGTLTQARIRLERAVDLDGRQSRAVRELGALNSAFQAGIRTPLDEALLAQPPERAGEWTRLAEVPFDFERRRVAVLLRHGSRRVLVVKGAPEEMLRLCTHHANGGNAAVRELDEAGRRRAAEALEALGAAGLRVLAIAHREHDRDHATARDEHGLVLDGFAAFADPPKPGTGRALAALAASGVAVKIVTGDGAPVTRHLCAALGIEVKGVLTGAEIARLDDAALGARAEAATLFCRVSPAQKTRIVAALKARGRVVGFLGDGINDAPALRAADVSLSVDNAVDVAKEAADLILLKRDLGVVQRGIVEGRRTFVNIRKYVLMGTSSNFGNMFSMAGAALFLPFLPLLPTQILLNNLLYDVSEIPIPLDRADPEETARPQEWDMRLIRDFMWVMGPVSSLFDFLTFYVLLAVLHANESLFRTGWFVESLATQVLVIFVIRTRRSPLASAPHPALAAVCLAAVALAVALPFTPLAVPLGFVAPPVSFLPVLAGLVVAYLALAELAKRGFYRFAVERAAR